METGRERRVPMETCQNFRDLGGYATEDGQRVQWQVSSGWNVPVDRVEVESFLSPQLPLHVECLAGPLGSTERCAEYGLTHTLAVHAVANQLDPGERMVLDLKLPPGAVPANAVLTRDFSLARAFSLTPASGAGRSPRRRAPPPSPCP